MAGTLTARGDRWRARYRGPDGQQHERVFIRKTDGRRWLDEQTAAAVTGTWVDPANARTTVAQWAQTWLAGYAGHRGSTVRQGQVHLAKIVERFGGYRLGAVRPTMVKTWTAELAAAGYAPSYVYALHRRLSQLLSDAVHDGLLATNPCSRRTSPPAGSQRPYVATTEQVWALHDALPGHLRPALLLGAFAGLRTAEVCGLRVEHVDFMRAVVRPVQQYPAQPLKSETSQTALPVPQELALQLAAAIAAYGGDHVVTDGRGGQLHPRTLERAVRAARAAAGLPEAWRFHDLRHYLASLLIGSGLDVKVVQHRLRHANAATTLNVYAHLWPDSDETARAAVGAVLRARAEAS